MRIDEYEEAGQVFIVAEIGQAHDGSFGILQSMVKAAAETGVNAVKFQVHVAQAESSVDEPFRVKFSDVDNSRYDYWKRMELSPGQWASLKELCDECEVEFLATPFSVTALNMLMELGVKRVKIGSGDAQNLLMLDQLIASKTETILSTGLIGTSELDSIVRRFENSNSPLSLLHCTTKYPTEAADIDLLGISRLKTKYGCPCGLSDHSGTIYPVLGAVALGAALAEVHVTFSKSMFGPDATASLTMEELKQLVEGVRFLESARRKSAIDESSLADLRNMFGRSLAVNRDMQAGSTLSVEVLESKKPAGSGLPVSAYKEFIGRKLARSLKAWEFIKEEDFE